MALFFLSWFKNRSWSSLSSRQFKALCPTLFLPWRDQTFWYIRPAQCCGSCWYQAPQNLNQTFPFFNQKSVTTGRQQRLNSCIVNLGGFAHVLFKGRWVAIPRGTVSGEVSRTEQYLGEGNSFQPWDIVTTDPLTTYSQQPPGPSGGKNGTSGLISTGN